MPKDINGLELKVGDKVEVIEKSICGELFSGYKGFITNISRGSVKIDNRCRGWFYGYNGGELKKLQKHPNPPHKHAELIKAWADGAIIQYLDGDFWEDVVHNTPYWDKNTQYRIKPAKTAKELGIEKIKEEINKLNIRLKELEDL